MRFLLQRVGSSCEALVVDTCRCSELVFHCSELLFRSSEFVFCPSEMSLPCDFWMCYIIIEMLYWIDCICLISIDSYDELMSDVRNGALTYVYTCDIATRA